MTPEQTIAVIQQEMPSTYAAIQAHAAAHGNQAFALVRRALRGEPNCFYAIEAGHVVGMPFSDRAVTDEVAGLMVRFGVGFLVIWPALPTVAQPQHPPRIGTPGPDRLTSNSTRDETLVGGFLGA